MTPSLLQEQMFNAHREILAILGAIQDDALLIVLNDAPNYGHLGDLNRILSALKEVKS